MKLRPRAPKGKTFRFFDLPAELRNTIYKVICDSSEVKLTHNRRLLPHNKGAFTFLQLTHVNHLLREEFLPIYYQSILPIIRYSDTIYFMRDFILPCKGLPAVSIITLNLTCIPDNRSCVVDVHPLLSYLQKHREIRLVFLCNDQSRTMTLDQLFKELTAQPDTLSRKRWHEYMNKYVKELTVSPITPSSKPHVRVLVKHAANEWWMNQDRGGFPTELWIEETGFSILQYTFRLVSGVG